MPWFRKYAGFSYKPVCWQGRVVLALMLMVSLPSGIVFIFYVDSHPVLGWSAGVFCVAAVAIGHAFVVWKLERDYGS